jgi:hypothetical protein
MVSQALTAFFIILFIIFLIILSLNGILSRLIDGVVSNKSETFVSQITGMETRDESKIMNKNDQKSVDRKIPLKVHTERGYEQNNFQVPNDIPLSQTSYAYYINKYYMNPKINDSVDEDMEIVGNANIKKPALLYDGIWKRDVKSRNDYQRIDWIPTNSINENNGMLSIDKMLEQARLKPMPDDMKYHLCNTNDLPFWEYDKICEDGDVKSELTGAVNQKCEQKYKSDEIVCFPIYLDPLTN